MIGVEFFETLRGTLTEPGGTARAVELSLKAEAPRADRFVADGETRLTGVIDASPWAAAAAVDGTLRISVPRRRIWYRLRFQGTDGAVYDLRGEKRVGLLRPIAGLTRVDAELRGPGAETVLARGEIRFDLRELLPFLRSWRLAPPLAADEPAGPPSPLAPAERETLRALCEAIGAPGARGPAPGEATFAAAHDRIAEGPEHFRAAWRLAMRAIDGLARARYGRPFARLDPDARSRLLARIDGDADGRLPRPGHLLLRLLSVPVKAAHFDRADYLEAIGHPPTPSGPEAAEPPPRYLRRVVAAEQLDPVTEVRAEVVVVGTGAGGAVVADGLARAGVAVAIVEEGRYVRRDAFRGSPLRRMDALYRYGGACVTVGTPVFIPLGRTVGGTTTINSGTCFGPPEGVLEEWRRELGFPDDFGPERLGRHVERVRNVLQVAPAEPATWGRIAEVVGRGADALGLGHGPLPRNAPGCTAAAACVFGCPEGAKRSTDVSYVPRALDAGAQLFTGLPVTRVLMRGARALGVEARGADASGAERVLRVYADHVVLACGTLRTPLMLRAEGIRLPRLGRNLSVHPELGLVGRCPDDLQPWHAVPQGYGIEGHGLEGVRFEGYWLPAPLAAVTLPWIGPELTRWMDDFGRLAQFGFLVRDGGDGSVHPGPYGLPLVRYRLSRRSLDRLKAGAALLAEVLLRGGATEVYAGLGSAPVRTVTEARALANARVRPGELALLGCHPLGTCALARSPETGVVDFDHRVFGTENLYVVDGSAVPTSLGVNPQVTIMALADRAAERLAARVGS